MKGNRKGGILIEAILAFGGVILPTLAFALEINRAAQLHVTFAHASFLYARARALGQSEASAHSDLHRFLKASLCPQRTKRSPFTFQSESGKEKAAIWGRLTHRYPAFFPHLQDRFQITKICRFSS